MCTPKVKIHPVQGPGRLSPPSAPELVITIVIDVQKDLVLVLISDLVEAQAVNIAVPVLLDPWHLGLHLDKIVIITDGKGHPDRLLLRQFLVQGHAHPF